MWGNVAGRGKGTLSSRKAEHICVVPRGGGGMCQQCWCVGVRRRVMPREVAAGYCQVGGAARPQQHQYGTPPPPLNPPPPLKPQCRVGVGWGGGCGGVLC